MTIADRADITPDTNLVASRRNWASIMNTLQTLKFHSLSWSTSWRITGIWVYSSIWPKNRQHTFEYAVCTVWNDREIAMTRFSLCPLNLVLVRSDFDCIFWRHTLACNMWSATYNKEAVMQAHAHTITPNATWQPNYQYTTHQHNSLVTNYPGCKYAAVRWRPCFLLQYTENTWRIPHHGSNI